MNVRRISTVSNLRSWIVGAQLNSTVPAIAHISFEFDFRSNTDDQPTIKAFAFLNYNTKQSTLEANWKSDKSSLFGDIQFNSPVQYLEFVKYTMKFTESSTEIDGSLETQWGSKNKITAEFVMKKVDGIAGAFRIVTPFTGYEITSAKYNFTKFQDSSGTTHLRMECDAVFKEYLTMFEISGSKSNSSFDGRLQLKTPFIEDFKIDVIHKTGNGKFNETLLISLAEKNLLFLYLDGEVNSFSNVQLSAGVQMPSQNISIKIGNQLLPGNLHFNCRGKWNTNSISTIAVGRYENAGDILSIHFDMTTNGSLLPQHIKLSFDHESSQGIFNTSLHLPGDITLINFFIINDSLNWRNKLDFMTPRKTGFVENKQSFKDGVKLQHEMTASLNGQHATGIITFNKDPQSFIIREAKAVIIIPRADPINILYELPVDSSHIRPSLILQFWHNKEIRIETDIQYQLLQSILCMEITSPFHKPIVVNASYSIEKSKITGQILTEWGSKKVNIESNLKFESDMMKTSGDFFIRHSNLDTDLASGSFGYNMIDPEITAHALGTWRDKKMGFGLSLLLEKNVYKGSVNVETPFQNWENLSLSGQVNMAKPTKLAVVTLSQNYEDITMSGLFSSDIYSTKFSVAMTSHIPGFHSISVYGTYDVPDSNDHAIELTYDNNGKKTDILAKLWFDNDSFLNAMMAETSFKTPFEGYETVSAHYSYNTRASEKRLNLQLVKSSWKFNIDSECSFGSEEGNGMVKVGLPFEDLKELSLLLRYGFRPSTLERTVNIVISRNQLVVEMAGALLISSDGSLTASIDIKSPVSGYKQMKCTTTVSRSKERQKIVTLTFSKDQEDYMMNGTFTLNNEARLVVTTPLKGYENIEARISYLNNDEDDVNSRIKKRFYGYLDMPTGRSELNIDLDLQKINSTISASIVSPLLMIPQIEIKGEYDLRIFPASVSLNVNNNSVKFMSMQMILEKNRLVGEIITPIDGYTDVNLSGSFRIQEDKKQTNFKVKFGEHSLELLSTTVLGALTSEIQAELLTTLPGMEQITLYGQYDLLHNEKTAELAITLDTMNIYKFLISGRADSKIGQAKVQMYTPISGFESVLLVAKYDLTHDYYANLLVEKNGTKNNSGGHETFSDDGTVIRTETPLKYAEDILLHGTYHTGNNERSANVTAVRNGHLTILDISFKLENNIAAISFSTLFNTTYELIITSDASGVLVHRKKFTLSVSLLKDSQYILKSSSHIFIDWSKEIDAQFELNTLLLPKRFEHLSFNLYFTPLFPPHIIQVVVMKNAGTILDLSSNLSTTLSVFIYDLKLTTGHETKILSIRFYPGETFVRFNTDFITAGTLEQNTGDLGNNKAIGSLNAIFTSPITGFEKFSFQWKQGYDYIYTELITPFKGHENHTLLAHFEVKHIKKSAKLFISRNEDITEFRTSLEHTNISDIWKVHVVTPFTVLRNFDAQTQYIKFETKKTAVLNVTANNHHFEVGGELVSEKNSLEAKLDISSSLHVLERINSHFFYDTTDSLILGGKLDTGNFDANISGIIDFDFLQGELLGSLTRHGQITEHRIAWSLENTLLTKTAKISINLGYELNFVIDAILNMSSLRNVTAQVSYIKPIYLHRLYPYTSTYKLHWNIKNIMTFDGGLFLMLHNIPFCNLNFNVDLDKATEANILNADYFGFFYNYRINLAYQLLNNNSIELLSKMHLGGTELMISLNFMPNKSKFITKCGDINFSLGYDLTTEYKVLDIEYQVSHNMYSLSSNLTLHKSNLPVISIALKTPIKHYSFLNMSNQYSMNTTHKGLKILLQKEDRNGEISFLMWKTRNNIGLRGNMSLPIKYLKSWYGTANLDMTSGLTVNVDCSWDSTKHLAVDFRYAPDSLKANINTPFTGLENINAEFLLKRSEIMTILFSVNWGVKNIFFNGTVAFNNVSKHELNLHGKYENMKTAAVTMVLQMESEVTRLEGQIQYFINKSKFDIDFISELNGQKMFATAGYDFEYSTKRASFIAKFADVSLLVKGVFSSAGMEGKLFVKTPFTFAQEITADGILLIGSFATFTIRWNDKLYTINGEYKNKDGQLGGKLTLVVPYIQIEDIKFDIKYDYELGYYIGATLKMPSVTLLKNLSFAASFDTENLTASAIGQWSASQVVNISANFLPSNQLIKVETPFEGFEKIIASGSIKNEDTQFEFIGKLEVGNEENCIYVHHIIQSRFMQHSLIINIPTYEKTNFNLTLQFEDPKNMSAKLLFGSTNTENIISAEGTLNLKDMFAELNVHHPLLEGGLTCKTLWDVNANLQIKTSSSIYTMNSSYTISKNDIIVKWNAQTPVMQSTTILGGSYEYDDKSELKTKLYFNEDSVTFGYKINHTSLAGNFKLNTSKLLKIKYFSLDIEGSYSPNLYGSVSYKYNTSSGAVAIFLRKTEDTVDVQCIVNVQPLLGPVYHKVGITYNLQDSQKIFECKYEGDTVHTILVLYENDNGIFKATTHVSSKILGTQKALILMEKSWAHLEVIDVLNVTLITEQNDGYLTVRASAMEHKVLYHFTSENGFHGNLALMSPLVSNGKVNVTATAKRDIENMFVDLKCVTGTEHYHATFKLNNSEEKKSIMAEITAALKTILSLNASIMVNRYRIQAETSLNFLETVSSIALRHKQILSLDTELNVMSPYLPKKTVQLILKTENNSVTLYASHGNKSYGEYIMLEGAMNHNDCMVYLNFEAPKLPLVQYVDVCGIFKLGGDKTYDLGLSTQFSSATLKTELSVKFHLSSAGTDTAIIFVPPWEATENYGAMILIPFKFSNSMRPRIILNLGNNNTYSLHGTFVNLEDVQQVGFGAQYKLRKLGGDLKIERAPISCVKVEIDIPVGDNIGHYSVDIKDQNGESVLGTESALNYTHINIEWDSNEIELRYGLSYTGIDSEGLLGSERSLECTLLFQLKTPFYGYEQNGLKMYVSLTPSQSLIITSLNYPGNSKPFGFELNYHLKDYNEVSLVSQLHIPFITVLEDVALVLSNKFEEKYGLFRSVVGGHWNKEELAITLEGNLKETVFKGTVILNLIGQTYRIKANYGNPKTDMPKSFVVRAHLSSPLTVLKNAEMHVEIDVMKSVLASIIHNSKEIFGLHIHSDEVTLFGAEVRTPWRSAYFVCSCDISRDIKIQGELLWDMYPSERSQFGIIFTIVHGPDDREDMSATLKLASRVLMLNITRQVSLAHIEHAGSFSWKKDQIVGFRTLLNTNSSSDIIAFSTMGRIDLPRRSFELGSYASVRLETGVVKYADIGTEFMWDALEDRNKKIGIALRHFSPVLEIVLQHAAMMNDLVIRIEKHGRLSYNHLPFTVKIEVEYSPLPEELITMEAYVQNSTNTSVGLNMGCSLYHIPTSTDLKINAEVAQTSRDKSGRISAEYLNSYTGQKHRIELMAKMALLQNEITVAVRTAENQLEVHGLILSGSNGHYGAMIDLLMNQKEPMRVETSIHIMEPRAELEVRYGSSRSYKMYAGMPHCREVTFGIKHVLYEAEYEDVVIMLRLNSSQQLWSRIKWQPRALTELKTGILQEYSDITHVVQSIGNGFSEAWLKDFAYKCNKIYPVFEDLLDHIVSPSMTEIREIYMDFLDMGEEMKNMYRRNEFYLQDIQLCVNKLM